VVNIGVNDDPVRTSDPTYSIVETGVFTAYKSNGLLPHFEDPDRSNLLSIDVSVSSTTSRKGAKVVLYADGSFDYYAAGIFASLPEGQTGDDSFTFVVVDGYGGKVSATASITVLGKNDLPVATVDNASRGYSTRFDLPLSVPKERGVKKNDYDPDQDDEFHV